MSDIKTITAKWDCKSEKSENYILLNMIHAMAGHYATRGDKSWSLSSTATTDNYILTVWTNGIVDIKAETYKDWCYGVANEHCYTMEKTCGETNG